MRLAVGDADEHRVAQTAERAATFHPIGGIQHFDPVILTTALEGGDELAGAVALQQLLEGFPLDFRERPKSPSERDRRLYVLDPLLRQLPPLAVDRAVEDLADQFRPVILFRLAAESSGQSPFVAVHHFFKHPGRRHARQIGPAGR